MIANIPKEWFNSINKKHMNNEPINNLQDLLDMMKFDNPDVQSLFRTAYNRGYQDGIKDTKESIKNLL